MRAKCLMFFFLFLSLPNWAKATVIDFPRERVVYMTGTIEKFGRNSIDILDEDDDRSKRLVCFSIKDRFHLGERVRVRYDLRTLLVESMQRMTPVEYKKDGQNAGYLFLAEAEGSSQ